LGGFGEYLRVFGAFEGLRAFKRSWEVLGGILGVRSKLGSLCRF